MRSDVRLGAWLSLVGTLIGLAYLSRAESGKPESDVLYRYETTVYALISLAFIGGAILLISIGAPKRDLFAFRPPPSWRRALAQVVGLYFAVAFLAAGLDEVLHGSEEQGLTPESWQPDRAGAYAANFVVIALLTPVVEELTFRGVGYSLLRRFGDGFAIVAVATLFGLAHGLIAALPVLVLFGFATAVLRWRTHSVFPGMILHAVFNGVALIVAVAA